MKYSIILPCRNGGDYIKECVHSILSQHLVEFDLILLDNNSTDGTLEWAESLKDDRVKIYSSPVPLSIEESWSRVSSIRKNEFMTIIGHDDILDANYLTVMDELISRHPEAGLYQTHFRYIDGDGNTLRKCRHMEEVQQPPEVLHNFISSSMDIMGTGFMTRSRHYDEIGGIPPYPNLLFADMELWTELSRKGYLAVDERECFSYRTHPGATTSTSTETKVLNAFEQFVHYLLKLKNDDAVFAAVIRQNADYFLIQYCQGITHKVLRIPHDKRQTPSVTQIIDQFRDFGRQLKGDNSFEPLASKKIRMGEIIDNNKILYGLFQLFKRIFRKPVF